MEDEPSHWPILDSTRDESSITEQTPEPSTAPFALKFKIIEDSTWKGRPKLTDSRGYSYGVKRRRVKATYWICTRRPKVNIISFAFNKIYWQHSNYGIVLFRTSRRKCEFFVLKTWQDLLRTGKYLSLSGKRYIFITKKKCFPLVRMGPNCLLCISFTR